MQPLYSATEDINAHTGGWRAITGQGLLAKMGRNSKRERCCFSQQWHHRVPGRQKGLVCFYVCIRACMRVCVCVCVRVRACVRVYINPYTEKQKWNPKPKPRSHPQPQPRSHPHLSIDAHASAAAYIGVARWGLRWWRWASTTLLSDSKTSRRTPFSALRIQMWVSLYVRLPVRKENDAEFVSKLFGQTRRDISL
jgi:hypothetical protein